MLVIFLCIYLPSELFFWVSFQIFWPFSLDCYLCIIQLDVPGGSDGKEPACNPGDPGLIPGLGRFPRRKWQPTPVFLPGESSWTEEPGGLQSKGSSWTWLSNSHFHFHVYKSFSITLDKGLRKNIKKKEMDKSENIN